MSGRSRVMTANRLAACWLWPGPLSHGYGALHGKRAHRVVYEAAYGPVPPGLHVLHRCDTPACVRPSHLFLGTQADNIADKVAKGRQAKGEGNNHAKLTESQVRAIRSSSKSGAALAREYGIAISTACRIKNGTTWKGVQ